MTKNEMVETLISDFEKLDTAIENGIIPHYNRHDELMKIYYNRQDCFIIGAGLMAQLWDKASHDYSIKKCGWSPKRQF